VALLVSHNHFPNRRLVTFFHSVCRPDVTVDEKDRSRLRALLTEKMGSPGDAEEHLPKACKRM
jgi:hypothetical protein